jgi:two-component system response regulator LytT
VLRVLIIDDELPARKELRFLIESLTETVQVKEAKNCPEALENFRNQIFDACFIDINLGDFDGINLAQELLKIQKNLKIIFATAYDAYAVKAFELHALDYILKPFESERVAIALSRITSDQNIDEEHFKTTLNRMAGKIRKLPIWSGDRVILVAIDDIVFITTSTSERICRIYTLKNDYPSNQPLNYFEQKFEATNFLRVNRSYLVNLDHILEIIPWFNHAYLLKMRHYEQENIIISRNKIKNFRLLFDF